jgi:hypothetical protein
MNVHLFQHNGETHNLKQWAKIKQVCATKLSQRINAIGVSAALDETRQQESHGMSGTPIYRIWAAMVDRCRNPNHKQAKDYSERGIRVCEEWEHSFATFYSDMGPRPEGPNWTLERTDNDEGYNPANCVWATRKQNSNNMRNNRKYTHGDVTKNITEWADEYGMSTCTLRHRLITAGWDFERAVTQPVRHPRKRR